MFGSAKCLETRPAQLEARVLFAGRRGPNDATKCDAKQNAILG